MRRAPFPESCTTESYCSLHFLWLLPSLFFPDMLIPLHAPTPTPIHVVVAAAAAAAAVVFAWALLVPVKAEGCNKNGVLCSVVHQALNLSPGSQALYQHD